MDEINDALDRIDDSLQEIKIAIYALNETLQSLGGIGETINHLANIMEMKNGV